MKKKEDEIIHHENQTNIFDIIEDTTQPLVLNVEEKSIKIEESIPYFKDNFPNLKLINIRENQYLAFNRGMTYGLAEVALYVKKNKNSCFYY